MADRVRNVQEFLKAIEGIRQPANTHVRLYRGQGEDWPLLPLLFRKLKSKVHLVRGVEAKMLKRLKESIPKRTPGTRGDDWDWLSFGQHYGLATRLLDWSEISLVALYFAVENSPKSPTVYVYHAQKAQVVDGAARKTSPSDITLTRIMVPNAHSTRVGLQKGWHTVHRLHPRKSGGKMVIPLADMQWHEGRLAIVRIDPSQAATIRQQLAKRGLYSATIYGAFEEVCRSISRECGIDTL